MFNEELATRFFSERLTVLDTSCVGTALKNMLLTGSQKEGWQ
jgi:hypothetical protein